MAESSTPTALLREEHQLILKIINVLERCLDAGERDGAHDYDALGRCISFFRLFADACHHGKEEDLLFPELQARGIPKEGGPIEVMLYEHQQGRAFVKQMRDSLEAARGGDQQALQNVIEGGRGYIELLRNHINKEDNVLFMMADQVVDSAGCQKLCGDYAAVCSRKFEGSTKQELEQLAAALLDKHTM